MFKRVKTNRLTGLVEIGELTCVESEKQLITSSELIGNNIAAALKFIARMEMATK
jgi:phage-related protein